eukprot:TRINITY_DN32361_c0_g1_i1.p1 TRINITY_DN32361_c0_g1~~TRINITY_DN32361_c0_g1_i1.p1  ORF type:complete len:502 (+),score=152.82 TRINITY_DN32361_c0_g1_i1:57-1562(+)
MPRPFSRARKQLQKARRVPSAVPNLEVLEVPRRGTFLETVADMRLGYDFLPITLQFVVPNGIATLVHVDFGPETAWASSVPQLEEVFARTAPADGRVPPPLTVRLCRHTPRSTWSWVSGKYREKEVSLVWQGSGCMIIFDWQERYLALKQPHVLMLDMDGCKTAAVERVRGLAARYPRDCFRLYETPNGVHCFCTSRVIAHDSAAARDLALIGEGDYNYAMFSCVTEYGHRLSSRVWSRAAPGRYPGPTRFMTGGERDFVGRRLEPHRMGLAAAERPELLAVVRMIEISRSVVASLSDAALRNFEWREKGSAATSRTLVEVARRLTRSAAFSDAVRTAARVPAKDRAADTWRSLRSLASVADVLRDGKDPASTVSQSTCFLGTKVATQYRGLRMEPRSPHRPQGVRLSGSGGSSDVHLPNDAASRESDHCGSGSTQSTHSLSANDAAVLAPPSPPPPPKLKRRACAAVSDLVEALDGNGSLSAAVKAWAAQHRPKRRRGQG